MDKLSHKQTCFLVALSAIILCFLQFKPALALSDTAITPDSLTQSKDSIPSDTAGTVFNAANQLIFSSQAALQEGEGATLTYDNPFIITGGEEGQDKDYHFTNDGNYPELHIHPLDAASNITIKNQNLDTPSICTLTIDSAATITLDGVYIAPDVAHTGAFPIRIMENASFDVKIILADNSENILTVDGNSSGTSAIVKADNVDDPSTLGTLTIGVPEGENSLGNGILKATGGPGGCGIGGRRDGWLNASNITITGGTIIATSSYGGSPSLNAAGIGGIANSQGQNGVGRNINIIGGTVKATGSRNAAGIGGTGDQDASVNNGISSNAVVIAESGNGFGQKALGGFGTIDSGLVFAKGEETGGNWEGTLYNSVYVAGETTFPTSLTVSGGKRITVGKGSNLSIATGAVLTIDDGAELVNEGNLTDDLLGSINNNGTILTRTHFYLTDETTPYGTDDYYQTYLIGNQPQVYKDLPNPDVPATANTLHDSKFLNWYYLDAAGEPVAIKNGDPVLLNQHDFHENASEFYAINIAKLLNGSITSDVADAAAGETVTLTVSPDEGYQLAKNSLSVKAGDTDITVAGQQDGTYTFTMPAQEVLVNATFEKIPEPTPPGPEPAPTPTPTPQPVSTEEEESLLPVTGDTNNSFLSTLVLIETGIALAFLGLVFHLRRNHN